MISTAEVLRYHGKTKRFDQRTIRRHYIKRRREFDPSFTEHCENPGCPLGSSPVVWNDKPLGLVLDHKDGVNTNNRLDNLWLLCPNCNSQRPTHAGRNKGRVEKSDGGFALVAKDGHKQYRLPADPVCFDVNGAGKPR